MTLTFIKVIFWQEIFDFIINTLGTCVKRWTPRSERIADGAACPGAGRQVSLFHRCSLSRTRPLLPSASMLLVSGSGSRNVGVFFSEKFVQVWQFGSRGTHCGGTWRWVTEQLTALLLTLLVTLLEVKLLLLFIATVCFYVFFCFYYGCCQSCGPCQREHDQLNRTD